MMLKPDSYSVIFLGTPEFALPALEILHNSEKFTVEAVVTQPDKPAGRGAKLTAPPIKCFAMEHDIPVLQPVSLKSLGLNKEKTVGEDNRPELTGEKSAKKLADFLNELPKLDAIVTVAYGKIIPPALLYYVPAGVINIHPSLIPRWRGAAPLQYAIYSGDSETGVALMLAEEGLDTGPVFLTEHYPISDDTTLGDLHDALCEKGASLLMSQLENILTGKLLPKQQDETQATYADKWTSEDAAICWDEPGTVTQRRVRASSPVPGARTWQGEALIKIYRARLVAPAGSSTLAAGQLIDWPDTHLAVVCGDGAILSVEEAQLPGKKRMPVEDLLRGHTFTPDTIFKKLI